ncbi:SsgA family sporulation/cell division regulator [Streptomyces sp. SudanB182_2057]|uniref:SsgA family sporulation/cell division regulator n=1 Tax=Streptomyces sp. SudanB182_2057 TaxID=3035281 RepID=UPI003F5626BC
MKPVQRLVTAKVSSPEHGAGRLVVGLRHDPGDPLAVRLDFAPAAGPDEGGAATWVFARSLLEEGVVVAVGDGDVRVRPGADGETDIELVSLYGSCVVRLRMDTLCSFLSLTETRPAEVSTRIRTELDQTLDAILGRA